MHTFSDWTDLLADAGARTCGHCGKPAMVPASLPQEGGANHQLPASPSPLDGDGSVWVCFECGHEDGRRVG